MLLYLAATNKVVSIVMVVERPEENQEHLVQRSTYFVSEVLTESKQRYPHYQKLAYGVFLASRKLRHYFQEHPITVVSTAPMREEHLVQRSTYFVSEVLTESKQRYPHYQKLAYGVFLASRKLRHYFQEHPITVVSTAPMRDIINNSDAT